MTINSPNILTTANIRQKNRVRNTRIFGILFSVFAALNLIVTILLGTLQERFSYYGIAEALAILVFIGVSIHQTRKLREDNSDQTATVLLLTLFGLLIARIFFTAGIGLQLGVTVSIITTAFAALTLPRSRVNWMSVAGFLVGALIIIFDYFTPGYRPQAPAQFVTALTGMAIFASIAGTAILIAQFKGLSLYSKISFIFSISVLLPILVVGVVNFNSLAELLSERQDDALINSVDQVALTVDNFIFTNRETVRVAGLLPNFSEYLASLEDSQVVNLELRNRALASLLSLAGKNPFIEDYALLDHDGIIVLNTNPSYEGRNEFSSAHFQIAYVSKKAFSTDVRYNPTDNRFFLIFSAPVRNTDGQVLGVLRVRYDYNVLQSIITQFDDLAGAGTYAILMDIDNVILANGLSERLNLKLTTPPDQATFDWLITSKHIHPGDPAELLFHFDGIESGLSNLDVQKSFSANIQPSILQQQLMEDDPGTRSVRLAGRELESRRWVVLFAQSENAFIEPVRAQTRVTILFAVLAVVGASILSIFIAQFLAAPVSQLMNTANRIISGDLTARAKIRTDDEIGLLAGTFNTMTNQLSDLIGNLENRILDRTLALERRASQFQAAAEVGRTVASVRDLNQLLTTTTHLISERFGYYHTGIFILNESRTFAELQAANSEGGQRMLARKHRLEVTPTSLVGYAASKAEARIALDVGKDAVFFNNPDLPETRSEIALPLVVGGTVLGVLDVQSKQPGAFSEEDTNTLQILADLLAVALENARLFQENINTIEASRRAFGELSQASWRQLLNEKQSWGFATNTKGELLGISLSPDEMYRKTINSEEMVLDQTRRTISVPIFVRGQIIGTLRLKKPDIEPAWTLDDMELIQTLTEQLSAALESARLYSETRSRAEREALITDISGKIGASMQVKEILQTAVQEISRALGNSEVAFQLKGSNNAQESKTAQ